jgi:phosphohistidine phosphatase
MLELLLLRHAKSRWDEPGLDDHDRDLAPRGLKAAKRMGKLLAAENLLPDLVLCSTARRAMDTWRIVADAADADPIVRFDNRLYLASPATMIDVAREFGGTATRLMIVGHDPGMHQLALALATRGDADSRRHLAAKFPTAALARFQVQCSAWATFAGGPATLLGFWRPRDVGVPGD